MHILGASNEAAAWQIRLPLPSWFPQAENGEDCFTLSQGQPHGHTCLQHGQPPRDGNDGPWPTFNIHVGTPPQVVRVLVSTALGETWVISANKTLGGCIGNDPSSCPQSRGGLYNLNDSSTWQDQGIYGLGLELNLEDYTQDYDNGNYGLDTLGIGAIRDGSNNMDNIVVAALSTKDFYLGYLGVTPHPTNFTEFNDPQTSYLSTLKQQKRIPSLSYAYSAGARYRMTTNNIHYFYANNLQARTKPMEPSPSEATMHLSSRQTMSHSQWQTISREI